ncbi:MAG: hypothetical protein AAFR50_10800, partial [Pseudomonadota bacterium]
MVLQKSVPYPALTARALPSLQVLDPADWLLYDEVETEQCALREALLASERRLDQRQAGLRVGRTA